jgi:hypothetical protein
MASNIINNNNQYGNISWRSEMAIMARKMAINIENEKYQLIESNNIWRRNGNNAGNVSERK